MIAERDRGAVLIVLIVLLGVSTLVGVAFARLGALERDAAGAEVDRVRAEMMAEAGVAYAIERLRDELRRKIVADPSSDGYYRPDATGRFPDLGATGRPSFALAGGEDSGRLEAGGAVAFFRLRVTDQAACLDLADGTPEAAEALGNLVELLGLDRSLADRIAAGRAGGGYRSRSDLGRVLDRGERRILEPYLTCHAAIDPATAGGATSGRYELTPRAPVGINTAGVHLVAAIVQGIGARRGDRVAPAIGQRQALRLARALVAARLVRPFATRAALDAFLAGTGRRAAGLSGPQVEALQVALDPNLRPAGLNHDEDHARSFDRADLIGPAIPVTFHPSGVYEIESLGGIRGADGRVGRAARVRTTVRLATVRRIASQRAFEATAAGGRHVRSGPEPLFEAAGPVDARSIDGVRFHLGWSRDRRSEFALADLRLRLAGGGEVVVDGRGWRRSSRRNLLGVRGQIRERFVPVASAPTGVAFRLDRLDLARGSAFVRIEFERQGLPVAAFEFRILAEAWRAIELPRLPGEPDPVETLVLARFSRPDRALVYDHPGIVGRTPSGRRRRRRFPEDIDNWRVHLVHAADLVFDPADRSIVVGPDSPPAESPAASLLAGWLALGDSPLEGIDSSRFFAHPAGDLRHARAAHTDRAMDSPDAGPGATAVRSVLLAGGDRLVDGVLISPERGRRRAYASQSRPGLAGEHNLPAVEGYASFWFKPGEGLDERGGAVLFHATNLESAAAGVVTTLVVRRGEIRLTRHAFGDLPEVVAAAGASTFEARRSVRFRPGRWVPIEFWWTDHVRCQLRVDGRLRAGRAVGRGPADPTDPAPVFGLGPPPGDDRFPVGTFARLEVLADPLAGQRRGVAPDRFRVDADPGDPLAFRDLDLDLGPGEAVGLAWTERETAAAAVDVGLRGGPDLTPGDGGGAVLPADGRPTLPLRVRFSRRRTGRVRSTPLVEDLTIVSLVEARHLDWTTVGEP